MTARGREDGFLLIAALWLLAALAGFASVFAVYASTSVVSARVGGDRLEAEALIRSALELAALRLQGRSAEEPRSVGAFAFALGGGSAETSFRSEGARIDVNFADKKLLAGLFVALGARLDAAQTYADRIAGWREKPGPGRNAEADLYKDAGLDYAPRQGPFQTTDELRFVSGLPPDLVEAALPFLTVFNGTAKIDVFAASPPVLRALPNLAPDVAATILQRRAALDPKAVRALLGRAADYVSFDPFKSARAEIAVRTASGRRLRAEVILLLPENDPKQPYRVLSWRDDFEGA
ncbi:general secretion pathway protein GspK [Methylocella sp.]|uniref:general secretion pathway protein GspK n=1 Tax=Methylocella sp. TaxID=1978226 RepID=UPI0037841A9B